jgi:hypothetical protein
MRAERIQFKDLPADFLEVLVREFVPYSVGLARVSTAHPLEFTPLGSGTLVKKRGRIGILTADHCLRALRARKSAGDLIYLVLRDHSIPLPPEIILEHELVTPASTEYGPDLGFLEIAASERLDSIRALASVWPLDRDPKPLLREFSSAGSLLASLGIPEERCHTEIKGNTFRRISYHPTRLNVIEKDNVTRRNGWDYIESKCWYGDSNPLPATFEGSSGGGIWGFKVHRNKSDNKLVIGRSALVGVQFYQTALKRNLRYVRGHFIRSIYDLAWRKFDESQSSRSRLRC